MSCAVLIAGAGPVGLTLAAELSRHGISVRIVDPAPHRTDKSKALVVWSRTLELLDRAGISADLIAAGRRQIAANIVANGKRIGRITLDGAPTPYAFGLMIPQSETERILEEHLNSLGVQVERTVALARFADSGETVSSVLRGPDGREEQVESQWLVGCDGAHSVVRHQLGLEFHGDTLISNWILADVYLTGPQAPTEIEIHWHAAGVLVFFPMGEGRCRVIFDVGPAEENHPRPDPTLAEIQSALAERGPGSIQAERPVWLACFRINERKVKSYRAGRVFLAGDAAHVHSPAGGQGMNTGMQDACNLAWKLALAQRGLADPERLLASYSPERSGVGEQILTVTGKVTALATLHGTFKQTIRNELAALILGLHSVRDLAAATLTEISIGYPHSPLNGVAAELDAAPQPGARAPVKTGDAPFGAGDRPRFALCAAGDALSAGVIARFPELLEAEVRPPLDEEGIVLVRPDGYVAMSALAHDWAAVVDYLATIAAAPVTRPIPVAAIPT